MKRFTLILAVLTAAAVSCSKGGTDPEKKKEQGSECVAIGGETMTMAAALERVSAAKGEIFLTMTDNYTSDEDLSISNRGGIINIDLNGKKINVPRIAASADSVNIFDNSASGKGSINGTGPYAFKLTGSRIRFSSGNISATNCAFSIDNRSKVYIYGGCIYVAGLSLAYNSSMVTGGAAVVYGGHFNFHPTLDGETQSIYSLIIPEGTIFKYDKAYSTLADPRCNLEAIVADISIGVSYWGGSNGKTWKTYRKAIEAAGANAVNFASYATTDDLAREYISSVDGLIIPGSANGDDDNRGAYEIKLLNQIVSAGKPVLGICYGHQRINKYKGGTVPDVSALAPDSPISHKIVDEAGNNIGVKTEAHSITIDKSSKLYTLLGNRETVMVNTSHKYALDVIGSGLKVVARAEDGIVEAIESTDGSMMNGVQFHPEGMYGYLNKSDFLPIIGNLIDDARSVKEK